MPARRLAGVAFVGDQQHRTRFGDQGIGPGDPDASRGERRPFGQRLERRHTGALEGGKMLCSSASVLIERSIHRRLGP